MDDNDIIIFMFTLFRRLPTKGEHIATVIAVIVNSRENSPILKFLAFITGAVSIYAIYYTKCNSHKYKTRYCYDIFIIIFTFIHSLSPLSKNLQVYDYNSKCSVNNASLV